MKARTAPARIRTAAKATTVSAPVGASIRNEPKIPAALAIAPASQPIRSATPMRAVNKVPIRAGTIRKQNTRSTPATLTDEVTTTPNDR